MTRNAGSFRESFGRDSGSSLMAQQVKNPSATGDTGDMGSITGSGRSLEEEMAAHSSILA